MSKFFIEREFCQSNNILDLNQEFQTLAHICFILYALSDIVLRQNITENQYKLVLINVILILLKSEVRSFYYERVEMKSVSDVLKCLKGKKDSAAKLP